MPRFPSDKRQRGRGPFGLVWGPAVALFAIICGVVLLSVFSFDCEGQPKIDHMAAREQIVEALGQCQRAERSLKGADYGRARKEVQKVRKSLNQALGKLQAPERSVP